MKKPAHSKIKNTAILFELLTRQVAADTIKGVEKSPALQIIREFFKTGSLLSKELVLYQTLIYESYHAKEKANYLVETVIGLRSKLDNDKLQKAKYELVKEIKKHYELKSFFKTSINEYKLLASIYNVFEGIQYNTVAEVVNSRFTVLEHLTRKVQQKPQDAKSVVLQEYAQQKEDVRLLAYKIMIDKFNHKYSSLSPKQRNLLKEYVNNVSNTTKLRDFIAAEGLIIAKAIRARISNINDPVTSIKLKEVANLANSFEKIKTVKENHVLSLMVFYELLEELKK